LLEKIIIKKIKKYKPPIHCEEDLHNNNVGSNCLILSKVVNPVKVTPEKDSKMEFISGN
tara:strand:+ start:2054 stop:2230 length:177 start_codon:yes stop_codon:yes gene_type:complete